MEEFAHEFMTALLHDNPQWVADRADQRADALSRKALSFARSIDEFNDQAYRVGYCANPIKLTGQQHESCPRTGEIFTTEHTTLRVPCGNRRANICPACSRTYERDCFEVVRTGVAGGKGVPDTVRLHPMVFITLTAPSFGPVHGSRCGKTQKNTAERCPHGRVRRCWRKNCTEPAGSAICPDCYDYDTHIVWQYQASELWRRFTISLRRAIASTLGMSQAAIKDRGWRVEYVKVAEFQARGAIHFHGLIRFDGPLTVNQLKEIVRQCIRKTEVTAPPLFDGDHTRILRWGRQFRATPVRDADGKLGREKVAGYLAKYATKATSEQFDLDNYHIRELERTARNLSSVNQDQYWDQEPADNPYHTLGKWAPMLGFKGHFSTKSRHYSVTLGKLRRARRRFARYTAQCRASNTPVDTEDLERRLLDDAFEENELTTVVICAMEYVDAGWGNPFEEQAARDMAAAAREYAQQQAA